MASPPAEFVFLNIPYDREFERLYLAYLVGLTILGMEIRVTLGVPNDVGRLDTIIDLIQKSQHSIHDLSRIQSNASGIPRFNMPLELGLALYRSRTTRNKHRIYIFEQEDYRIQQSTSDLNGIDPKIHDGTPKGIMSQLRNIFLRESETSTVPEMMMAYRKLRQALPRIRQKGGWPTSDFPLPVRTGKGWPTSDFLLPFSTERGAPYLARTLRKMWEDQTSRPPQPAEHRFSAQ